MKQKIDKETVKHVAFIARLMLSEKEISKFSKDLNDILDAFSVIDDVHAEGVEPSFQPLLIKDIMRDDELEPSLSQTDALLNTEHKEKGFFKGPRAV